MILVAELAHEHRVEILVLVGMLVSGTLVVNVLLKLLHVAYRVIISYETHLVFRLGA